MTENELQRPTDSSILSLTFILALFLYLILLSFRGFGWDGDSIISAQQFVKLFNPNIYGMNDGGTHPKLLAILVFGLFYKFFGNFIWLTLLSILLNSLMIAVVCTWVHRAGGTWLVAFTGLAVNTMWHAIVLSCDNTAFSIPFAVYGLYVYFPLNRKALGSLLLLASNLFRPGAEFILLSIVFIEALGGSREARTYAVAGTAFALALFHSLFGYLLAYPSKEQFLRLCVTYMPNAGMEVAKYRHSVYSVLPYLKSVLFQLVSMPAMIFFLLALPVLARPVQLMKHAVFLCLAPLSTLVLPAGIFLYGVSHNSAPEKHMEYVLVLPAIAAFHPLWKRLEAASAKKLVIAVVVAFLACAMALDGMKNHGKYEWRREGDGILQWRQLKAVNSYIETRRPDFSALISPDVYIFFILDNGAKARTIDYVKVPMKRDAAAAYDYVFLSRRYAAALGPDGLKGFTARYVDRDQIFFVNNALLP